jgi:CBS domain-containing protein
MDSDPTATGRGPAARPVTPTTSVAEARAHLRATGEAAAVVYRDGRPVGVVTASALADAAASPGPDTPIEAVMDYVAVPVDQASSAMHAPID